MTSQKDLDIIIKFLDNFVLEHPYIGEFSREIDKGMIDLEAQGVKLPKDFKRDAFDYLGWIARRTSKELEVFGTTLGEGDLNDSPR